MIIASFDVDAQNGFTANAPQELPVPGGHLIAPALNTMAQRATLRLGSKDAHPANAAWVVAEPAQMLQPLALANADLTWVSHCVPGTPGFELLPGLPAPIDYDYFVWKGVEPDLHPYGACYHDLAERRSTGVIEFLKVQQVQAIIVGGLALDYCVRTTALQLRRADFEVLVYLPACRALSIEGAQAACTEMANAGIQLCGDEQALDAQLSALKEARP
ncbi:MULTISPECIES: nicotinamidase [unclassified Pseudomonas]|uniref:nicotinamidase n=1 Tax=unclassified Pseudomonas TaxID=196821 RepID=UPI000C882537|nr:MULTISPECIES: nicotinamidase [unclassified Pseudomonas]PMZ92121.1 nicotinamidase [Pseudomonas sp. FW305-42]PNA25951.1 nicotinamidase [Pseudomonas sp. MPR-R1B]PNB27939.1 nicotinamidase [Pseudomonas sp. DP16D-E2]PNB44867.1 nicotinamidase [Pseudomonas sp. FW305-17]PNB63946.1 nicotinamidase [Pseudomonas sp. GW531-E2]